MAAARLPKETCAEVFALVRKHGSVAGAAGESGVPYTTFESRWKVAKRYAGDYGLTIPPLTNQPDGSAFEIDDLPSELPTADELVARRRMQFKRKSDAIDARKLVPVRVKIDGPFAVALFGDPHVDDDGTDIELLEAHMNIVAKTEGMLAGNVGDYSNNWVGRLARLYGQQSTSAAEAWVLVEWLVKKLPWLFLIGGNHDLWSGDGDPVKWMAKAAKVQYQAHGMRLGLTTPEGRVIRLNARHDFSGHSQWNTAHGPAKAAQMGWRDHLLVCGHKHTSGYQILRDPADGLISHAIRVGSYKTFDRYAEEKGLPNQTISPCVVAVIQPDEPDDSPKLVNIFHDVQMGADVLKMLRRRKSTR